MTQASSERDLLARKSIRSLIFLYFAASAIGVSGWYVIGVTTNLWHWVPTLLLGGSLSLLFIFYRNFPLTIGNALFLLATATLMFSISYQTYIVAALGRWSPIAFFGYKLLALAVALVAPASAWSAYLIISFCALNPTIQTLVASPVIRANYSIAEPWVSVIYAVVALFVLRHRYRTIELERRVGALEAERRAVDHMARIFLGMRDLTNSPLQAIELTTALLKEGQLTAAEAVSHLEKSMDRLEGFSRILTLYEKNMDWSKGDLSFDATSLIQQQIIAMRGGEKPPK